jgi:hypothetical protein
MKSFDCIIPINKQNISKLNELNKKGEFVFEHYYSANNQYYLELSEKEISLLEKNGITFYKKQEIPRSLILNRLKEKAIIRRKDTDDAITTGFVDHYLTLDEINDHLTSLAATFPTLCNIVTLPYSTSGYDGSNPLLVGPATVKMLRITTTPSEKTKPGMLLICGTHAREWINPIVAVEFAEQLLRNYNPSSADPDIITINRIVEQGDIFIVPVMNPDGFNYSLNDDNMWRKNRRSPTVPTECFGVDLNRNYEIYFGGAGSSASTCSDGYHGPAAFSEPENRNIKYILDNYYNILIAVDSHSAGDAIYRPIETGGAYIASEPVSPVDEIIYQQLETAANNAIFAVSGKTYYTGTTNNHAGTSDEYMFFSRRIFAFDFECASSFQPPIATALNSVNEVTAALRALALKAVDLDLDSSLPVSIMQCIDRTSSMVAYNYSEAAKANAKRFVDLMSLSDETGIVSFADPSPDSTATPFDERAVLEYPLTAISSAGVYENLKSGIEAINFYGWTSIGEGLLKGAEQLAGASFNKFIILISDGFENREPWVADVLASFPSDIKVYTIALGSVADVDLLQNIASVTGGQFYMSPDTLTLFQIYNQIRADITDDEIILNKPIHKDDASSKFVSDKHEVMVENSATSLTFSVSWNPSDNVENLSFSVVSPNNMVMEHGGWRIKSKRDNNYLLVEVKRPMPGKWTFNINNLNAEYVVSAFVRSAIEAFNFINVGKVQNKFAVNANIWLLSNGVKLSGLKGVFRAQKINIPEKETISARKRLNEEWKSQVVKEIGENYVEREIEIASEKLVINGGRGLSTKEAINNLLIRQDLEDGVYNLHLTVEGQLPDGSRFERCLLKTVCAGEVNKDVVKSNNYLITGKVVFENGKPAQNIKVEAFDKDLIGSDALGIAMTDQHGNFKITYKKRDFKDFLFDKNPDLYFKIRNAEGEVIVNTKNDIMNNARQIEEFFITIPQPVLEYH